MSINRGVKERVVKKHHHSFISLNLKQSFSCLVFCFVSWNYRVIGKIIQNIPICFLSNKVSTWILIWRHTLTGCVTSIHIYTSLTGMPHNWRVYLQLLIFYLIRPHGFTDTTVIMQFLDATLKTLSDFFCSIWNK